MAAAAPQAEAKSIGSDDYSLSRVPRDKRFGFWSMLLQWLAQSGSISQFTLGATIGVGMTFGNAFLAFTLGAVILEIVIFAIGLAGMREGLATPMLTRWVGFGRNGSALVSFVIAVSLVGWFGVQNTIFGNSVSALVGGPSWIWCVLAGMAITALVIFGFRYMAVFAKIVTPLFFAMVAWSVVSTLKDHSISDLINSPPPGQTIPLAVAATAIAGGFMTGAIVAPEMTRYNRKGSHVFIQSASSMILSEYIVGMTGVLLGHLVKSNEVSHIVLSTSGAFGVIVVLMSTAKINDWNLYGSSLGVVNFFQVVFGKRLHRGAVTIVLGIAGDGPVRDRDHDPLHRVPLDPRCGHPADRRHHRGRVLGREEDAQAAGRHPRGRDAAEDLADLGADVHSHLDRGVLRRQVLRRRHPGAQLAGHGLRAVRGARPAGLGQAVRHLHPGRRGQRCPRLPRNDLRGSSMTTPDPAAPLVPASDRAQAEVIDLCAELIRFDTSNPTSNERASADWVVGRLAEVGIDSELVESAPGRANVVARIMRPRP